MSATYPFSAIVGQASLKQALVLNAVNPSIGGVLIRGEKGTAKSTAVRALAQLLPEISVVRGCAFSCDPAHPIDMCENCRRASGGLETVLRRIPVVTLPLNSTEDRVAGSLDFNRAVKTGTRHFEPGLLAKAHRGILYVDEVNLLDDHIVDMILDAASSGGNRVEREGISYSHPSRFILVGTMNPEEGELRPQLLDRFGLCVEITSEKDIEDRVELMLRREQYDADPDGFARRFETANTAVADQIMAGRHMLSQVTMPPHLRGLIADICAENHVAGHRADIVIEQTARALAAVDGREDVSVQDIQCASELALLHRRREVSPPPPQTEQPDETPPENEPDEHPRDDSENQQEDKQQETQDHSHHDHDQSSTENESSEEDHDSQPQSSSHEQSPGDTVERVFEVGETFKVRNFSSPKDRICRRGSGRRSRTKVTQRTGRYVRSTSCRTNDDIALDATLRSAAPYQLRRRDSGSGDMAVIIRSEDIREKIREKRSGNFLLFLVDASGSMGARGRMTASKGAIMSLLLDAYQKRDRIAMVSFRKDQAVVNLPPTSSVQLAASMLRELPVGGRTPLSAGITKTHEIVRAYLMKEPTARPIVIVITDGKANAALADNNPREEAFLLAQRIAEDSRIQFIVVDTEGRGLVRFGLARELATSMNARYFQIEDLKADSLINIVKESLS